MNPVELRHALIQLRLVNLADLCPIAGARIREALRSLEVIEAELDAETDRVLSLDLAPLTANELALLA
jgi:hypothetical protein